MSNWTHVAGIARIDGIMPNGDTDAFAKHFGKECLWEDGDFDDAFKHPDDYLPMGSEGSLHMSVWVNPDPHCLAAYTVSIFGDLRDHHDPDEIVEWFKKKLEGLWVRNACIVVENERSGRRCWNA